MRHNIVNALILAGTVCLGMARADLITFSLTGGYKPDGTALIEKPGETGGWGFTITNNTDDYALITSSEYCIGTAFCGAGTTESSALGIYTDFIATNAIVVGPDSSELWYEGSGWYSQQGPTYSESYSTSPDPNAWTPGFVSPGTGVGSFYMNPTVHQGLGTFEDGRIYLTFTLYSDPTLQNAVGDENQLASAFARVVVPEYSALVLLVIMLPLSWWVVRRRRPLPRR